MAAFNFIPIATLIRSFRVQLSTTSDARLTVRDSDRITFWFDSVQAFAQFSYNFDVAREKNTKRDFFSSNNFDHAANFSLT